MLLIFGYTLVYVLIHKIYDAAHALWPRLLLVPIFILLYVYKDKIDEKLKLASTNLKTETILKYFSLTLIVARLVQFIIRLTKPVTHLEDIAYLYYHSIKALFYEHVNPYTIAFDAYQVTTPEGINKIFTGLKYPPLQLFFYYPFVALFDLKGFYVAHFFYYTLTLWLLYKFLTHISKTHAYLGIIWLLITDYFFTLSFNKATNDFLPTLLILIFSFVLFHQKKKFAGTILALSILSKQLPGLLFLYLAALQKQFKVVIYTTLIIALISLPFFIWDPHAYFSNLIEFPAIRPSRESSFLMYLPAHGQKLVQLLAIACISLLALLGNRKKNWNLDHSFQLPFFSLLIFLVFSKMSPTNYFVWVTPLTLIWLLTPSKNSSK